MTRSLLLASMLPLGFACGGDRAPSPPPPAASGDGAHDTPAATSSSEAGRTYLDANDFDGERLEIGLPASPAGETLLVVVPELTSAHWLAGDDLHARALRVSLSASAIEQAPSSMPGHALPEVASREPEEWKAPPSNVSPDALATERTFEVYDPTKLAYTTFSAKRSYVGERYAYYDDVANEDRLGETEYATIDREVTTRYAELVRIFGEPGDADANGKHLVVMSKTTWLARKNAGEAYVDGKADGEILTLWSLDGLGSRADQEWLTRTILHETVHLSQNARAMHERGAVGPRIVPAFYVEGMAETMRIRFDLGGADGTTPDGSPFASPYAAGGVFAWWLEKRFGAGIHQRIIDASLDASLTRDVTTTAFAVREPLVFAWFWSEIAMEGGLKIDDLSVGTTTTASAGYTDAVIRRVKHSTPVSVTLRAENDQRATVMIVRR
jgi:hypothetical protein